MGVRRAALRGFSGATLGLVAMMVAACSETSGHNPTPGASNSPVAVGSASADPCAAPESRQFDFYLGVWAMDWQTDTGVHLTGRDSIVKNGCELEEVLTAAEFLGTRDYRATSRTYWDPATRQWTQIYRDNNGQMIYRGGFAAGQMVLSRKGGMQQRLIWRDIATSTFVWEFDGSQDGVNWSQLMVVQYYRLS